MAATGARAVSEETANNGKQPVRMKRTILDAFEKLTHRHEKVRNNSAVMLVKHLQENADIVELKYALKRIVRGLGAPNKESKVSFYTTLVAVLSFIQDIDTSTFLECVKKNLTFSGSNSKSENGDVFFGRILAYGAFMRTGLFPKATKEHQKEIFTDILEMSKKRAYLRLPAFAFILLLCEKLKKSNFEKIILPLIFEELSKSRDEHTLDSFYLFYAVKKQYPDIINASVSDENLCQECVCIEENITFLVTLLSNIPGIETVNHPLYSLICKEIAESPLLIRFVEEMDLQLTKLNYNRHTIVTIILTNIINNLNWNDSIPDLLRTNYIQQTLQYFKSVKRGEGAEGLQQRLYELFNTIITALERDDTEANVQIGVLKKLLFYPGIFIFEKLTRSKIVQQIVAILKVDGVKKLAELYRKVILGDVSKVIAQGGHKPNILNSDKVYASQLLVKLLSHPAVRVAIDWKADQLKFLMELGLLNNPRISSELSGSLRMTYFQSLALKLPNLLMFRTLQSVLVHHLDFIMKSNVNLLRNPLNDDTSRMWQQSLDMINNLENKRKLTSTKNMFLILFQHMALQLFNDVNLAVSSLKELFSCFHEMKKTKKVKDEPMESDGSDELQWIEVIVDLFLNLLSHNSNILRNLMNCVFPNFCQYLNMTALHQILDVLDPEKDVDILSLKDVSDEDDDVGSNETESDESESETESDESESETESDESETEENETTNDKLRQAVQAVFRNNGYQTDEESIDVDDISESEGQKLDDALAEAFKQFKPNAGKNSRKRSKGDVALIHFRVRVLDLIDCFLDSTPSMDLCLEIMVPLLKLAEFCVRKTEQKPLLNRTRSTLKRLTSIKKFSTVDVREEVLIELYRALLQKDTKSLLIMQEIGDKVSECCIFILYCSFLVSSSENTPKKTKKNLNEMLVEITNGALQSFCEVRSNVLPFTLFKNIFLRNWKQNVKFIPFLYEKLFCENVRHYKRMQIINLLETFYTNKRLILTNLDYIQKKLLYVQNQFFNNAFDVFKQLTDETQPKVEKAAFITSILSLLMAIKKSPLNSSSFPWIELGNRVQEYKSSETLSKDAKKVYIKFCQAVGISPVVAAKRKHENIPNGNDGGEVEKTTPKKRIKLKNNNKNGKLQKKVQDSQLQSLSEEFKAKFSIVDTPMDVDN